MSCLYLTAWHTLRRASKPFGGFVESMATQEKLTCPTWSMFFSGRLQCHIVTMSSLSLKLMALLWIALAPWLICGLFELHPVEIERGAVSEILTCHHARDISKMILIWLETALELVTRDCIAIRGSICKQGIDWFVLVANFIVRYDEFLIFLYEFVHDIFLYWTFSESVRWSWLRDFAQLKIIFPYNCLWICFGLSLMDEEDKDLELISLTIVLILSPFGCKIFSLLRNSISQLLLRV